MSYFEKLKKICIGSGKLTAFQDDLLKHDKKELSRYTGEFLFAFRKTGTNLFLFTRKNNPYYGMNKNEIFKCFKSHKIFFIGDNEWFYHGKDGDIKRITKEKAIEMLDAYVESNIVTLVEQSCVKIKTTGKDIGIDVNTGRKLLFGYSKCWQWIEPGYNPVNNYTFV